MTRDIPISDEAIELLLSRQDGGSSLSHEGRDRILDALERLSPDQQAVINGVFWEGLSIRSIAREHGWNRARASALQASALKALAAALL